MQRLGPVDLDIRGGEIVGVVGNGQDELAAGLAGLAAPAAGSPRFAGADTSRASAAAFRAAGIGYVSGDRAEEGLSQSASTPDNFLAGREAAFAWAGALRLVEIRRRAEAALAALNVRYGRLADPAASLSDGNQQRLVLARELDRAPKLIVAVQPTRGVDIAGAAFRDRGGAALVVSEDIDEALALSDRVVALYNGLVAAIVGGGLDWPSSPLIAFASIAAAAVGALWMLPPALLRTRLGLDEVVVTLMLNFVAVGIASWLVDGPLLARNSVAGVALVAILFGALSSAGANIQLFSDAPVEIVEILQGATMIFAAAQPRRPRP